MKMNKVLFLLMSLLFASLALAAAAVYQDQGVSSIAITDQGTSLGVQTVEVSYIKSYLGEYSKEMLLKVQTTSKSDTGLDGIQSQSLIEARSKKDFFASVVWSATDAGSIVEYLNEEMIRSMSFGCCGEFDRSVVYNVETGNSPATYLDSDFFTISVPNSGLSNRYFAQIEDKTAPSIKNGEDYIGSIGYFDVSGRLSKVRFYAKLTPGWGATIYNLKMVNLAGSNSKNEIRDHEMELWDSDGVKVATQAYQGFGISGQISFDDKELNFTLPVTGDQINAAGIKVSPGLGYEFVP